MSPLARAIEEAGRSLRRATLIEAGLAVGAIVACTLLVGWVAALLRGTPLSLLILELGALAFGAVGLGFLWRQRWRRRAALDEIARWLDQALEKRGQLGGASVRLLSALELGRDRGRFGESPELVDAAIAEATALAQKLEPRRIVAEEHRPELLRFVGPFAATVLLVAIAAMIAPQHLRSALMAAGAIGQLDQALERLPPEPRLGDFRITYQPPAYSDRAPSVETSPSGSLRALAGTEVTLETRARDEVTEATLLVTYGNDTESPPERIAVKAEGRRLKVTMVLTKSGRFRYQLKTTEGELQEQRRGQEIELDVDDPPEVSLLEPKDSPLEVNERDRVTLAFTARDDFALGEAAVAWRVLGTSREGRSRLTAAPSGLRSYTGSGDLDLGTLDLKPGDKVAYTVEVRDNDTVNGPKVGQSETKELRIYSKKVHHQQVMALQEQALDELVHILGDNLENRFEPKNDAVKDLVVFTTSSKIVERALLADQLLVKTVLAVKKDPMGRPQVADAFERARVELVRDARRKRGALTSARAGLERAKRIEVVEARGVRVAQDGMVGSLEKNAVYLADLLNDQRMIDAEQLAKDLRAEQQALRQAIEEYKKAPTEEKRAELAKAIQDIRNRIQEIGKQLSSLRSSIPQDFVNPDALDGEDSAEQMDEIQEMLEKGELDAAMKALDRMLGKTEQMLAELGEGREEIQSREYSEITEMGQQIWKDLDQLEKDQRDLARRTESISKEIHERMKSRLGDPASFVERQKKRLEQAKATVSKAKPDNYLPDAEDFEKIERRLDDAIRALEAQDFGAAQEVLQQAAGTMAQVEQEASRRSDQARRFGDFFGSTDGAEKTERTMRRARPPVEEVLGEINDLMPPPESLLSETEREQLQRFGERQSELEGKAGKLRQDLDKLSQLLPIVGQEVKDSVDGAKQEMGNAKGGLGSGDAPGALGHERSALDKLGQLKDQLSKMGEGGQGGSGGVPLPFGEPSGGGPGGQEHGRETDPFEKVQIPKPEEYQAPAEFREDLLEAAKHGTVDAYKEAVRRYYEELVK